MKRSAQAVWQGGGKFGTGYLSTDTKVLNRAVYSAPSRFETGEGTNPEELIAAAHAGCFSMALAFDLEKAGFKVEKLTTLGTVTIEKSVQNGWSITAVQLDVSGQVSEIDKTKFAELAEISKVNCPISKLLNVPIALHAELVS